MAYNWYKKLDDLQKGGKFIYYVSNSDRLLRDHKARGNGDLVDVLGACDLDSRLT